MDDRFYETRPLEADTPEPDTGIEHVGAGWYQIRVDGEVVDKVRGEESAEQRLEKLR
jgi:hypothetical protein